MLIVLRNFIFLVVEVLLGGSKFHPHYLLSVRVSDFLTLTASKFIKESTATVAALLSA